MVRINDMAPVMRAAGNGVELAQMNFSFAPCRPKGGPVFNFRSEGWDFSKSGRCLIAAPDFFEYVGTKCPKTQYQFTLTEAPFLAIVGLWREAECNHPVSFTMLTTSPGPDIAPCHDRQVVVLRPENWAAWFYLNQAAGRAAAPAAGGIARCRDGPRGQAMNQDRVLGEGRFGLFCSARLRHVHGHERRPLP
ncbi:SOS response-associated peptidase family protein [Xanthobacter autotrophicus]|uniref:SOS response-associated peptidase family protein n=1 Tax=Xanthobacter autotrophicus TaxID=280 RepID=UPI00372CB229